MTKSRSSRTRQGSTLGYLLICFCGVLGLSSIARLVQQGHLGMGSGSGPLGSPERDAAAAKLGFDLLEVDPERRRPPAAAEPTSEALSQPVNDGPGTLGEFERCLNWHSGDPDAIWSCSRALALEAVSAAELSAWVCSSTQRVADHQIVLARTLSARPPEDALEFLNEFQLGCTKYRESVFTIRSVELVEAYDPRWVARLQGSFTPEALFPDSGAEAAIQVAAMFIDRGDPLLRGLIEDGGLGIFGGSSDQVHRSALISLVRMQPGRDRLEYIESVAYSASTPAGAPGYLIADSLANGSTWIEGESAASLETLLAVLDDPRFSREAAAQVAVEYPEGGTSGVDPTLWARVYGKAKAILAETTY